MILWIDRVSRVSRGKACWTLFIISSWSRIRQKRPVIRWSVVYLAIHLKHWLSCLVSSMTSHATWSRMTRKSSWNNGSLLLATWLILFAFLPQLVVLEWKMKTQTGQYWDLSEAVLALVHRWNCFSSTLIGAGVLTPERFSSTQKGEWLLLR